MLAIEKEIAQDSAGKKQKIAPLMKQLKAYIPIIADPKTPFAKIASAHRNVNRLSEEMKYIHLYY